MEFLTFPKKALIVFTSLGIEYSLQRRAFLEGPLCADGKILTCDWLTCLPHKILALAEEHTKRNPR